MRISLSIPSMLAGDGNALRQSQVDDSSDTDNSRGSPRTRRSTKRRKSQPEAAIAGPSDLSPYARIMQHRSKVLGLRHNLPRTVNDADDGCDDDRPGPSSRHNQSWRRGAPRAVPAASRSVAAPLGRGEGTTVDLTACSSDSEEDSDSEGWDQLEEGQRVGPQDDAQNGTDEEVYYDCGSDSI